MAAGDLDTSFGGDGRQTIDFGGVDAARVVLVQPDGRIVLAGRGAGTFAVARLRPNGSFDTSFSGDGRRTVDFGAEDASVFGGALQADGKIVLAGDADLDVAVVRLEANGALDTTFSGDGKKRFRWGAISRAMAVLELSGGKLLLAGLSGPEGGNLQVARLNPGGALDATFGTGGKAAVDFGGDDSGHGIARQANGRILVAGRSTAAGAIVARLRAGGGLDPDFDGDGRVTVGGGSLTAVLVQPDRTIVVAGNAGSSDMMTVTRLRPNGSVIGTTSIDFGPLADLTGDAALAPDGKIVVAGSMQSGGDLAVARLNPDGSPDATFGTAGKATVGFGAAAFGFGVAVQPNGRIVVAGQLTGSDDFAIARLLG